jgi:hypothetical protein
LQIRKERTGEVREDKKRMEKNEREAEWELEAAIF